MGFLLLHYEYQRANNQYNLCERTGIRLKNQVERYTKRVSKMEEMFTKAQNRLENNWNTKVQILNNAVSSSGASAGAAWATFAGAMNGIIVGNMPITQFINVNSMKPKDGASEAEVSSAISQAVGQVKSMIASITAELKEADIEKLKAQQDQQLQPIAEKETEYQSEETTNETLTDMWQQRKEKAKDRLAQDIKDGVGGYGLQS